MSKFRVLSYVRRHNLLAVILMIGLIYSFLLFRHARLVNGQAAQPLDAEAVFNRVSGPHSAHLATGYFDRTSDQMLDPLTKKERLVKEQGLSGCFRNISDPGELVDGRIHDWNLRLADVFNSPGAMPTAYAKALIAARLVSSHAFVGEDHQSVYTEYSFTALNIYKSDDPRLQTGSQVMTTRYGGSVIFPSGHQRDYIEEGEGVPKIDSEYILFLWRPTKTSRLDYGINAIYEMREGKLYAVDPVRPFTDFEGKSLHDFLAQVEDALSMKGER